MDQLRGARRAFALPGQRRGTPAPAGGSFWYPTGDPGPARPPLEGRATRSTSRSSAAGSRGCGRRSRLLEADPSLRVVVLEAERVGRGASGRNGGFCAASLTHGLAQRAPPLPRRARAARGGGPSGTSRELVAFVRNEGIDAELEETGTLDVATEPWQVDELARVRGARGRARHRAHVPRPGGDPGAGPLAALPGRRPGRPRAVRDGQPGEARLGARPTAAERRGAPDRRARRGCGGCARRAGRVEVQVDGGGIVDAEHVLVGDVRVQRLDAAAGDHVRAGLRLRADDRAAHRGAARRDRLGRPRGHVRRGQPVPLLPAVGRRPDPVGRLRRDLPPGQRGQAVARPAAGDVRPAGARSSSRRSPSSTGSGSRTAGAGRSTPRPGSRSRSARRSADACTTRSATRASGVGATRWAAGVLRDMVLDPSSPLLRLRFVRSRPFPIPPEPARTPAVELMRRVGDRRPTRTRAAAARSSRRWTRWGSASTA